MENDSLLQSPLLQTVFLILYGIVFIIGLGGNSLVVFVVFRKKAMQTLTNIFITNLAMSDIMMCLIAIPFTPFAFFMKTWIFGEFLCALLPMMMCVLVYVSTLTCATIAALRHYAILHPLQPKMRRCKYFAIAILIWAISIIIALPLGIFNRTVMVNDTVECIEIWPKKQAELIYTCTNVVLQYLMPCSIIILCYLKISIALDRRSKSSIVRTCTDPEREQREIQKKRRTNRMMIYVAMVFVICWMPLNLQFMISYLHLTFTTSPYFSLIFLITHLVAMSSTTYNPFIYVFMSKKFKTEFKDLFSCLLCK